MENDVVILSEVQCIKYYLSTICMQYNKESESSMIKIGKLRYMKTMTLSMRKYF